METDKGVIGANLRAAQPTTDPQDLARSEMMRLICREADKSFFHFRGNYIGHLKEDETVDYYRQPPSDTLHALDSTPDGLTQAQADERLARDVEKFMAGVRKLLRRPVTEAQLGAMTSLAYNIGIGAFGSSTLLRLFNAGQTDLAAAQFAVWRRAGGKVLQGLVNRRADERRVFEGGA